ncbi:MAG: hypothetical protein JW913_14720 [Chitinispirillaceae bacterium]|nr:hypothetical protein [Chitinispirillaceae bacterium]
MKLRRCIVLEIILVGILLSILQCAMRDMAAGSEVPSDHPIPTTASILPLQADNRWIYRYSTFDSTGSLQPFPDRDLKLAITGMYRLGEGGELVPITRYEYYDSADQYFYRYEWESLDSGYLVCHRGTGEVNARGLYIAGTFVREQTVLFDTARLWFAYPGGEVTLWTIDLPGGDTVASTIECASKTDAAWFSRSDSQEPSPLVFLDSCYLYREKIGEDVYYHCFHPAHGKVSMRHYYKGVLRESYVLISETLCP